MSSFLALADSPCSCPRSCTRRPPSRAAAVVPVPGPDAPHRQAHRRPRLPHDPRGEGVPDGEPHAGHPRLGVPEYNIWSEALHGVAASASPRSSRRRSAGRHLRCADASRDGPGHGARSPGQVQPGREGRACRAHDGRPDVLLAEHQHLPRPALGRGQETYGEDPFLSGRLGVAFITGMQGDDLDHPVVTATAKHYAVHSGPSPCGTASTRRPRRTTSRTPTCPRSARRSSRAR